MKYRAIVTDIEGTTSRISFVTEVLFPYAREHLPAFIYRQHASPAVAAELAAIKGLLGNATATTEDCIAALMTWIEQDKKVTPLKTLQGMVWQEGYQQGHFQGHIYQDAAAQLANWQQQGIRLYVYSSGSVQAQQLLFQYSEAGDLRPLFSGYFDTHIGPKQQSSSYAAILQQLQLPPSQVLFLSDVAAELDAAKVLGIATVQLIREQQAPTQHQVAHDFYQIEV